MTFDPLDQTKGVFFDQTNFQMFCVQAGFADVKVKGKREEDNFRITVPARGPVKTMKFSGGQPKILSIQTRSTSVEFVNMFSDDNREQSLPQRTHNSEVIGFYWVFKNEFVVMITASSVELYQCSPHQLGFKILKSFNIAISWAIFSPDELVLVVCSKGGNVLHPFWFKSGVAVPIVRLPKIEVELGLSRDLKTMLKERDVFVMSLYRVVYVSVVRTSPQGAGVGSEVLLYTLFQESQSKLTHQFNVDIPGRCTLSVVDNLVVVHHQASKTSMVYDISFGGVQHGSTWKHNAVLAPLPIEQCFLYVKKPSDGSSPKVVLEPQSNPDVSTVTPELYSLKWIFFQPNIVIDAHYGVIWKLKLDLSALSSMITDKCNLTQLLLMRSGGKSVILDVCRECLEPGRQANLAIIGAIFDQLNQSFKTSVSNQALDTASKIRFRNMVTQKDVYSQVLAPYSDKPDMGNQFIIAVTVEYIRSLNKFQIAVEHFLFELVMNLLIESKSFYQLHQFLQYHVISDSKALATLLLSKELVYHPATQLAMDMFKRLGTADSEIIDILLSSGKIMSALRFVKVSDKIDTVSARQFLEAAANEDDKMLFYTVYKFFEERNIRLRKKPEFPPDEHCQQFEALFRKWFLESS